MSDWLGLAFIVALVVGAVIASAVLGRTPQRISEEEFERRVREGQRAQAAVFALQQLLQPKAAEAVAVQQDMRHGYYNKKRVPGAGDDDEADAATVEPAAPAPKLTKANDRDAELTEESDA
ncbi:MAG TPA: hypothetical protein VF525_02840 [Pyrinomonadaceae bacterium]|jgi:hypothetical protein